MEDQTAQIAQLRQKLVELQFGLDSLGASERLTQRGRIEDTGRQIKLLLNPVAEPAVAPVG